MRTPKLVLASLLLLPVATLAVQERVQKNKTKDFPSVLTEAGKAWEEERFGGCVASLREAMRLASIRRAEVILGTLPHAPEGYTAEPDKSYEEAAANPLLGAMAVGLGNIITQRYVPVKGGPAAGKRPIQVTVTADSPLVQMLGMMIGNPAMLPKGSELIRYGSHSAILEPKSGGKTRGLQILLNGKDHCDVQFPSDDEDALFAMFDQAFVDRLAGALGK